jgi:hypothetical protein
LTFLFSFFFRGIYPRPPVEGEGKETGKGDGRGRMGMGREINGGREKVEG